MVSSILQAQQLVVLLKELQIQHIVISPGSRNAPLTLSFNHDSFFNCYSIVDERCAAHVALGMAQQLKHPVALLCTSGSALLNYYPAVAEAFYSEIPLIVLSADRPPHKIDIADGQTIRQDNVYKNHILADGTLRMLESTNQTEQINYNKDLITSLVETSKNLKGPVHLNIPFEEPLYDLVDHAVPFNTSPPSEFVESLKYDPTDFLEKWQRSTKKLLLIATLDPDVIENKNIDKLIKDPSVLIMTEVSSNVVHDKVVWGIDSLIAPMEKNAASILEWQPEMVVTIGGMIVSKKIKQQLRKIPDLHHYHVGLNNAYDTFFCLKEHFKVRPSQWIIDLPESYLASDYQTQWLSHFKSNINKKQEYLKEIPWSDFKAFKLIFTIIPDDYMIQLGNSSTIRYAQLFKMNATHKVFSNRGTSGIDGSTSTAIGAAMVSNFPTVCITGDISFFYDSNALWNRYIPSHFKIILINNGGGGIFRILPGHENSPVFDTYFETQHELTARHLCTMFGFDYQVVDSELAFAKAIPLFLSNDDQPQLLEIQTPGDLNDQILLDYFKYLR